VLAALALAESDRARAADLPPGTARPPFPTQPRRRAYSSERCEEPAVILVTGATGNAGGAVMRALLDRSEEVRALVRDGSGALPDGVARAVGDLNRPDTLTRHLDGVVVVCSSSAATEDSVRRSPTCGTPVSDGSCCSLRAPRLAATLRWRPQLHAGDVVRLPFADVAVGRQPRSFEQWAGRAH
jgi:hypothetical protein